MFCDEALDAVEAIAAGDLVPEGRVATHLATCPNCAHELARARLLESSLRTRDTPTAPPQFTARTLARIRRAKWRSDQLLDAGFNLAIAAVVVAVAAGIWMLLNRAGLAAVGTDAVDLVGSGFVSLAKRVAPAVPLYAGAALLLVSALGIWWWAERDAAL